MSFGTMFTILFTWYFQSLGINLGILPTALLAIPFGIIITIFYVLVKDKLVFSYYRTQKSPPVMLAMVSIGTMFVTQAIVRDRQVLSFLVKDKQKTFYKHMLKVFLKMR